MHRSIARRLAAGIFTAGAAVLLVGCGANAGTDEVEFADQADLLGEQTQSPQAAQPGTRPGAEPGGEKQGAGAAQRGSVADAQIIGVLQSLNSNEIAASEEIASRTTSPEMRAFAEQMAEDHWKANQRLAALADQLRPIPSTDAFGRPTQPEAAREAQRQRQQQMEDRLEQNFLTAEVARHERALEMIDSSLMRVASSPAVQQELTGTRAQITAQLARAQELLGKMGGQTGGQVAPPRGVARLAPIAPPQGAAGAPKTAPPAKGAAGAAKTAPPPAKGAAGAAKTAPPAKGAAGAAKTAPPAKGAAGAAKTAPPAKGAAGAAKTAPPAKGAAGAAKSATPPAKGAAGAPKTATPPQGAAQKAGAPQPFVLPHAKGAQGKAVPPAQAVPVVHARIAPKARPTASVHGRRVKGVQSVASRVHQAAATTRPNIGLHPVRMPQR